MGSNRVELYVRASDVARCHVNRLLGYDGFAFRLLILSCAMRPIFPSKI